MREEIRMPEHHGGLEGGGTSDAGHWRSGEQQAEQSRGGCDWLGQGAHVGRRQSLAELDFGVQDLYCLVCGMAERVVASAMAARQR